MDCDVLLCVYYPEAVCVTAHSSSIRFLLTETSFENLTVLTLLPNFNFGKRLVFSPQLKYKNNEKCNVGPTHLYYTAHAAPSCSLHSSIIIHHHGWEWEWEWEGEDTMI